MATNFIANFSEFIKKAFQGTPFGNVYPAKELPIPSTIDGRTAALRLLRRYISELTFYRTGPLVSEATASTDRVYGAPIAFRIKEENIFIEAADKEVELSLPTIAIDPGKGIYNPIGLTAWNDPDTQDVYGKGTIVTWMSEYQETLTIEISASNRAERRALVLGLEQALNPTEQMSALRFKMDAYYGQLCAFSLNAREFDDSEAMDGRRKARLEVDLTFTQCALVNYTEMNPMLGIIVTEDPSVVVETEVVPE